MGLPKCIIKAKSFSTQRITSITQKSEITHFKNKQQTHTRILNLRYYRMCTLIQLISLLKKPLDIIHPSFYKKPQLLTNHCLMLLAVPETLDTQIISYCAFMESQDSDVAIFYLLRHFSITHWPRKQKKSLSLCIGPRYSHGATLSFWYDDEYRMHDRRNRL